MWRAKSGGQWWARARGQMQTNAPLPCPGGRGQRHCVNIGVQRSVGSLRQIGTHDLEQRMAPQSIGRGLPTNEFDVGGLITVDTPAAFYPAPQGSVSVPRKHGNTRAVPP